MNVKRLEWSPGGPGVWTARAVRAYCYGIKQKSPTRYVVALVYAFDDSSPEQVGTARTLLEAADLADNHWAALLAPFLE